jgi:hypothetical protein
MTLYEMTSNFAAVLEMAQDPNVDPEAIKDTLQAIDGEIEEKADGYAKVIKELKADADKLSAEIKRLTDRKKAIENNISNMQEMLTFAMQTTGKTKFKTELFNFNIQKNPPSLVIDYENNIPLDFYIAQPSKVDKDKIKSLLLSGEKLSFAHIEQKEGVRIR